MSEFKNLTLEVADEVAVLAISRPGALNALNSETLDELNVALTEIEARDDVKVLILTGGPDKKGNEFKSFVAGAERWITSQHHRPEHLESRLLSHSSSFRICAR